MAIRCKWSLNLFADKELTNVFCIVSVTIKSRIVSVIGPRGELSKNLKHLAVSFVPKGTKQIEIALHHGTRKNVAALRTVRSIIENMITGVTKGFKYKMRYGWLSSI